MTQSPPPLQPAQVQQQLADARLGAKKLRLARGVALTYAWMIAIFAVSCFICGFGDAGSLLIGIVLGVIAYFEFDGANRLRRLDITAPRRLAYNRLAFAAVIIVYVLWSLKPSTMLADLKTYGADVPPELEGQLRFWLRFVYAALIALVLLWEGGIALYYISRAKYLERYVSDTPSWILEMQRAGGPL